MQHSKVEEATGKEIPSPPSFNTKPASFSSPSMSSISGIMQKAIQFPLKNKKLMLQVFILVLFPFLVLVILHSLTSLPLIRKVEESSENSTLTDQDLISLVVIEIPFAFAFCLLLLFASSITIFASVSVHQGASLGIKETLLSIKSSWKKILVSGLYISFLMIAFVGVTIVLTQLTALMGVFAALIYPYLASICTLVLVISTVEDEYYQGERAFRRAKEIIKQGGFQSYFLMLMLTLLSIPVYVLFYVTSTDDDDENGMITQFSFLLVATNLFCLTNIFNNVVYTLFYLDYKQRNGEKIEIHYASPSRTASELTCVPNANTCPLEMGSGLPLDDKL